ncbi:MAG: 16S rRNA (uracil(1498)-N(3))-methyltransferase [Saprospiraceae bacterium]|nr:16S rRNA (uracil(1498)-N(3))-methyltransferase [Saprospiraceae bacterium]
MKKLTLMFLFYSTLKSDECIVLAEDEHQHCTKVLRKQLNDQIFVTDGKGHIFTCTIVSISKNQTQCQIVETVFKPPVEPGVTIAISPTKNAARIEWFVEKAVEIGISSIVLFQAKRTEKKSYNPARLEKIMVSAMKQSLNVHLPAISYIQNLFELIKTSEQYTHKFIAYCDGPTDQIIHAGHLSGHSIALIGPEGDFTGEEINLALAHQFIPVSLGESRLRTETAGIMALIQMKLKTTQSC